MRQFMHRLAWSEIDAGTTQNVIVDHYKVSNFNNTTHALIQIPQHATFELKAYKHIGQSLGTEKVYGVN